MKKVTIYDIASALNLSTATIHRALNNKPEVSTRTRELVQKKAAELGFSYNKAAQSLGRSTIVLDFVICNRFAASTSEVVAGVRQAYEDLHDYNIEGNIHVIDAPGRTVEQAFTDKMEELCAAGHPGILLVAPADSGEISAKINEIIDRGTQVALVNSEYPGNHRLFSLRQNAALSGSLAAELLYWFAPSHNVAVFTGYSNVLSHAESVNSFVATCEGHAMRLTGIVENYDDPLFAAFNAQRLLEEHPETEGLYINTGNSISICQKLREMGLAGKVKVVASDLFPQLVELMRGDVIQASIFQNLFGQGYEAMMQLYRCIAEGEQVKQGILIEPRIYLRSSLDFLELPEYPSL